MQPAGGEREHGVGGRHSGEGGSAALGLGSRTWIVIQYAIRFVIQEAIVIQYVATLLACMTASGSGGDGDPAAAAYASLEPAAVMRRVMVGTPGSAGYTASGR